MLTHREFVGRVEALVIVGEAFGLAALLLAILLPPFLGQIVRALQDEGVLETLALSDFAVLVVLQTAKEEPDREFLARTGTWGK